MQGGQIQAEFRSISPGERAQLRAALKDRIVVQEAPWVCKIDLLFNTEAKPFDELEGPPGPVDGHRPWGGSKRLSKATIVKPVGGPLLPGSPLSLKPTRIWPRCRVSGAMPRSRARKPRRLLAAAGASDLKFKLVNRNVSHPFTPVGVYLIDQWRRIGIDGGPSPA